MVEIKSWVGRIQGATGTVYFCGSLEPGTKRSPLSMASCLQDGFFFSHWGMDWGAMEDRGVCRVE